jgi:tetratricopeptide (TPR) repeat protein
MATNVKTNSLTRSEITHILARKMIDSENSVRYSRFLRKLIPYFSPEINENVEQTALALENKNFSRAYELADKGSACLIDRPEAFMPLKVYLIFVKGICSMHLSKGEDTLKSFCLAYLSGYLPDDILNWAELQKIRIFLEKDKEVFNPSAAFENAKRSLITSPTHPYACELRIIQTLALNQMERYKEAKSSLRQAFELNKDHPMITSIKESFPYLNETTARGEL